MLKKSRAVKRNGPGHNQGAHAANDGYPETAVKNKRLCAMGMLAASAAHELRNPLGVIKVAVYNIRKKSNDQGIEPHIKTIEKKISDSMGIINNMLTYSKIRFPRYSRFSLYDLLDECAANAVKRFEGAGVKFKKDTAGIRKDTIEADALQLKEVFVNILNNGFQAVRGKNPRVALQAVKNNGIFEIEIKDNGVGIENSRMEIIFTPFFTSKAKGTGLGLPLCRDIVNLHNGRIEVKSRKNSGSSFTVILPEKKPR
jgi:signal transduction histidine kinase